MEQNKNVRESLKRRTKKNFDDRDKGGKRGKNVINVSDIENIKFFKPEVGKNEIDIVPYIIGSNNHPALDEGFIKGTADYVLDYWKHKKIGPTEDDILCLKKTYGLPCPVCEEVDRMYSSKKYDKEDIKPLRPTRRVLYNIIDKTDENEDVQLFDVSHFLFEKELLEEAESSEEEIITFSDLEDGRTVTFRATEEDTSDYTFMKFKSFGFKPREEYTEEIFDKTYPLDTFLSIPTYDEVKDLFEGKALKEVGENNEQEEKQDIVDTDTNDGKEIKTRKRERKQKENKCPSGFNFGVDVDVHKECRIDCPDDVWNRCAEENEKLGD